ncbi:hypothetical protein [Marinobacter sp. ANT_B65]|uniref:hypothetical protein n=1 Tax=Marinobacter sp. ANT_B65 TaxID=2039467 RepID=UPI00117E9565|nr:hypothetical protein [Marinobacter sp. ANT_B65]
MQMMIIRSLCLVGVLLTGTLIFWFISPDETEGGKADAPITSSPPGPDSNSSRIAEPLPVATSTGHGTADVQLEPLEGARELAEIDYRPLLAQGKVSKSELALILSSLDDAQLLRFLLNNTHLTLDDFFGYQNPTKTARTLAERWLNNTETFNQDGVELLFGTKSAIGTNQLAVQSEFSDMAPRLYAYYKVPNSYSKPFVFMKWTNTNNDTLWVLDKQPLTGSSVEIQEAWLRYSRGWPSGKYQVELISAEEGLEVLASQSFEVVDPESR